MRFLPDFVVGMPVAFAIFLFALEMPVARFQLKPGITLFFDMSVTSSQVEQVDAQGYIIALPLFYDAEMADVSF